MSHKDLQDSVCMFGAGGKGSTCSIVPERSKAWAFPYSLNGTDWI